jgi:hypothetical protein
MRKQFDDYYSEESQDVIQDYKLKDDLRNKAEEAI